MRKARKVNEAYPGSPDQHRQDSRNRDSDTYAWQCWHDEQNRCPLKERTGRLGRPGQAGKREKCKSALKE